MRIHLMDRINRAWRRHDGRPRTRAAIVTGGVIAIVMAPVGVARTGDVLREGVRNGTTGQETQIVANIAASGGQTGGYATRQSNKSSTGGGAIYGCRSGAGGSTAEPPQEPCLRANNLRTGLAFEFQATGGTNAGTITVGGGGDGVTPFTTNATGVATGLNADRVDGAEAAALRTRWLLIDEAGRIEEQSGGFTVIQAYQGDDANVYVDAGTSMAGKGLQATIAMQNGVSTDEDADPEPNFGGEVSVARCQTPAVTCAPEGARKESAFVVSPRNSDGTATAGTAANPRKRVYVTITE